MIDWTVAVYIVLPALVLVIAQYLEWWKKPPLWLDIIPIEIFLICCYLFIWSGTIRIFLEEGDQLFLLQQKKWLKHIMRQGINYSIIRYLGLTMLFFLCLVPFLLLHYQLAPTHICGLFIITFLLKILFGLTKQFLHLLFDGWKGFFISKGTLALGGVLFIILVPFTINHAAVLLVAVFILIISIRVLIRKRLNFKGGFFADVAREQSDKLRYTSLFLAPTGIKAKKPSNQRIRPWIFRGSNLIFKRRNPVNGLVEVGIKATLRKSKCLLEYTQLLSICILILLGVPGNLQWLIWLAMSFILTSFVGLFWKEAMSVELIQSLKIRLEDKYIALQKFLFIMALPGFLLISIAVSFQNYAWAGVLFVFPISIILIFCVCRSVSFLNKSGKT